MRGCWRPRQGKSWMVLAMFEEDGYGSTYVIPEASDAKDEVNDARAPEAELSALETALLALEARLDASLAREEVALLASLARLDVALPAPLEAEAKADDKTPRAPVEMAVADALADWAIAGEGQHRSVDGGNGATHTRSKRCRRRRPWWRPRRWGTPAGRSHGRRSRSSGWCSSRRRRRHRSQRTTGQWRACC
jgi:hypothetical protein